MALILNKSVGLLWDGDYAYVNNPVQGADLFYTYQKLFMITNHHVVLYSGKIVGATSWGNAKRKICQFNDLERHKLPVLEGMESYKLHLLNLLVVDWYKILLDSVLKVCMTHL